MTDTKTENQNPLLQRPHVSLPSVHLLQRKCSWFLLPSGLCGYCKINLLDWRPPTQVGTSTRSTQTTLEESVLTANLNSRSSLFSGYGHFQSCAAAATVYQSTHMHRDTHNQQLFKILTAQISTPNQEVERGKRTKIRPGQENYLIIKNKND